LYNIAKEHDLDVARCNFYFYNSLENTNKKSDFSMIQHNTVYSPLDKQEVFYQQPSIWASIYKRDTLKKYNIRFLEEQTMKIRLLIRLEKFFVYVMSMRK
jgi:hypothetical protein